MTAFVDLTRGLKPDALQARLFAGEVLIFRGLAPVRALAEDADRRLRAAFPEAESPERITERLDRDVFVGRAADLRRAYHDDPAAMALWRRALEACGCVLERTYWDRLRVRVNPPGATHHSRRILNLPAHRDSWGSMLPQQINWWAPVYPLDAGRTLLIYPDAWNRPVENDSAGWDLETLRRERAAGRAAALPLLPTASRPEEWGAPAALLPDPGDLVAFSAAHLHASAVNRTGRSRFNIEGRTVDVGELDAGRGAPDPDGRAPRIAYHWFEHCRDGAPLPPRAAGVRSANPNGLRESDRTCSD